MSVFVTFTQDFQHRIEQQSSRRLKGVWHGRRCLQAIDETMKGNDGDTRMIETRARPRTWDDQPNTLWLWSWWVATICYVSVRIRHAVQAKANNKHQERRRAQSWYGSNLIHHSLNASFLMCPSWHRNENTQICRVKQASQFQGQPKHKLSQLSQVFTIKSDFNKHRVDIYINYWLPTHHKFNMHWNRH
jgi:hypothetical protein